jgi:tight adherence protein C
MTNESRWIIALLIFGSAALFGYAVWSHLAERARLRRRLSTARTEGGAGRFDAARDMESVIDVETFGFGDAAKRELRRKLVGAGFFGPDAVTVFVLAKILVAVALPLLVHAALTQNAELHPIAKAALLGLSFLFAWYAADGWLARRKRMLEERFRLAFPDLLDLLVVCVDAGLSLEAALERITQELEGRQPQLHRNLLLLGAEMRAGRGTVEALKVFAERLGIEEARALVVLLRQSAELGTDIALALRTFSDEMREKRASRAEEKAHALPVKLVIPLALFVFPVILIVIMTPLGIRIAAALK